MLTQAGLVTTLPAPLPRSQAHAPQLIGLPGARMLTQRSDDELVVRRMDGGSGTVRFPAPWPRRYGTSTVAPDGSLAVFAGVHAVRAVDPAGEVRWEIRHGCWSGGACGRMHSAFYEYADDRDHRHAEGGSAGFSADGRLVWAHIRGPLPEGPLGTETVDEWLLIDAADGRPFVRADIQAAAAGSEHVPHPDPAQMGLSIGEGQDGAPLRWGRWDGDDLHIEYFDHADLVLLGVSPSGDHLMTVNHDQDTLAVHETKNGSVTATWDAESTIAPHPETEPDNDEAQLFWDWAGGFVDESTVIAGTAESDEEWGEGRHWLLRTTGTREPEQLRYPFPVSGIPTALGDGTWYTVEGDDVHVWTCD
jgi:hypothetical protein